MNYKKILTKFYATLFIALVMLCSACGGSYVNQYQQESAST